VPTGPRICVRGRNIIAHNAGVSVSATIAEMMTEIDSVNANCW
jgi:hypothetical protein